MLTAAAGGKVKRKLTFFLGDIKSLGKWDIHTGVLKGHTQFLFVAWRVSLELGLGQGPALVDKWTVRKRTLERRWTGARVESGLLSWKDLVGIGGGLGTPSFTPCLTCICDSVCACAHVRVRLGVCASPPGSLRWHSPAQQRDVGQRQTIKILYPTRAGHVSHRVKSVCVFTAERMRDVFMHIFIPLIIGINPLTYD